MRPDHSCGPTKRPGGRRSRRGFSLIQLLVALGILATLAGILLAAMAVARRAAVRGADTQIMGTIKSGLEAFSASFDIAPPLVKDRSLNDPKTIVKNLVGGDEFYSIAVYTPAADANFLRGANFTLNLSNPLDADRDRRYSENSLGIYLAGALAAPIRSDKADVPIDMVAGPGIGRPNLAGGFEKGNYGPYIDAESRSLRLVRNDDKDMPTAVVQDRNGVAVRYYRWLKNKTVTTWDDLNIPPMVVGPDYAKFHSSTPADQRDQPDPRITAANWAFVMAGPNRVFGDEPVDVLVQALRSVGASVDESTSEAALRARAWEDNLVEVGSAIN